MSHNLNNAVSVIGIDIGKNSFHVVGLDSRGAIVLRQKWSRGQIEGRLVNMPPCLVGMEACVGAHHLSRKLGTLGHDARLMPAKYVRPYSKGQKNDFRDAEAIAEAVQRPTMKFVATKTAEQLDLQALHRVRERLVSQRTGIINQIRAFLLERGIAVRQGLRFLRVELPRLLATPPDVLSPRMVGVIEGLAEDWRRLDQRIESLIRRDHSPCAPRRRLQAAGERSRHRTDHLERYGGRDRHRRCVLQRPRLRRLAGPRAQADLDWRPHHPRQDIEAGQPLPARSIRASSVGRADQATELGASRAQALDRGRQEAAAPQCSCDRACQQTGQDCLERSGSCPKLRGEASHGGVSRLVRVMN